MWDDQNFVFEVSAVSVILWNNLNSFGEIKWEFPIYFYVTFTKGIAKDYK